jgi:hypothetical protein
MADSYEVGWWSCAYVVTPVPNPPSLPLFRQILFEIKGQETGWPVWLSLENRTETRAHIAEMPPSVTLRDASGAAQRHERLCGTPRIHPLCPEAL